MKKIVMLTTMAGPAGVRQADGTFELPDSEADDLIACGAAKVFVAPQAAPAGQRSSTDGPSEADRILAAARAEAERVVSGAKTEAEKIVSAARAEAEALIVAASADAAKPAAESETAVSKPKKDKAS